MSCCVRTQGSLAPIAGSGGPIMGTWDYKWPLDSCVRVAFQRPPGVAPNDRDFNAAKAEIIRLAEQWHDDRAAISFVFSKDDFAPPADEGREVEPQRRSNLDGTAWRSYDVLVSVETLPLTIDDPITEDPPPQTIFLPFSQLGTYARRVDFGTPTMFVGPLREVASLAEYYRRDPIARTMVVHESGHALGLAHEHQSPKVRAAMRLKPTDYDVEKIRALLTGRLGIAEELLEDEEGREFLESHLQQTWPGNERFSDWRETKTVHSVMSVPYHDCSLKTAAARRLGLHVCEGAQGACEHYQAALFEAPTAADRAFLRTMYPKALRAPSRPRRAHQQKPASRPRPSAD